MRRAAVGFDVIADSGDIRLYATSVAYVAAGTTGPVPDDSPTSPAEAVGYRIGADAERVAIVRGCASDLHGRTADLEYVDESGVAPILAAAGCR